MAPTMKFQNYFRTIISFTIFVISTEAQIFPQTGQPVLRSEDNTNHEVKITNIEFPFQGSRYTSLFVSKDGLVGFHPSTLYRSEDFAKQLTRSDPAFVAPFYFPAQDIGSNIQGKPYDGQVLFRHTGGSAPANLPTQELYNYSQIIQNSMIGIGQFKASFGLVVTWKNVISRSDVEDLCTNGDGLNPCKRNTFQLAMLTDGKQSFAIFNYVDVNITVEKFIMSGFNAGEGRGYTRALKGDNLQNAAKKYGSDVKGRYIYRIDNEQILKGGCSDNPTGDLSIYPKHAGMFGGRMIDVSGPCLNPTSQNPTIRCRFNNDVNEESVGFVVNTMKVRCYVPTMSVRGWIKVELSVGNGPYSYGTTILIVHPNRVDRKEMLSLPYGGPLQGWNETKTNQLSLTWNSSLLSNDYNAQLNISLMGYSENNNKIEWPVLHHLGTVRVSANSLTFDTTSLCVGKIGSVCDTIELGFVKAELQDQTKATLNRYLVSGPIPLGFYVNYALEMEYGENWESQKCRAWYNKDKQDMRWLSKLEYCPCNVVQALSDIGRWQTDEGCNLYAGSVCEYHKGAVHCVRSVTPSPDGAGNQCCYNSGGNLMFAADSYQGSTPDRSHTWGAAPYGRPGLVPSMSHWIKDVVSFYYCCLWTDYSDCDYYMDQRPTRDCSGYNSPVPAVIYGQGHIQTFDGYHHRMCAEGDFVLLNTTWTDRDTITVQGRFMKNIFGDRGNSSVMLSSVAVRVGTETVEIRLDLPNTDTSHRHVDVLVNQRYYFIEDDEPMWQDFKKFIVVNSGEEANFTIILQNGLGIQVADCNLTLCVLIMAPPTLKGKVEGLLGNFNGNSSDDFLSANQSINQQFSSGAAFNRLSRLQKYQYFQYRWALNRLQSIIPMHIQASFDSSICSLQPLRRDLTGCNGNMECLYDYRTTGNAEIALHTLLMSQRYQQLRSFVTQVRICGLLDVPRSIKDSYNYELGSTVTIQGCREGHRQGDAFTYTCTETGNNTQQWSPSISAKCAPIVEEADTAMIVGIIVGVLAFFVILIAVYFLVRKFRRGPNRKSTEKYGAPRNPVSEGPVEYTASYNRPHRPKRPSQEDIDKEYSI